VQALEVTDAAEPGYWQKRGWDRDAQVAVFSRIDAPGDGEFLKPGKTLLRGIAFAGDRGIQYVQVSLDGENTWTLAKLEPAQSPWSWVFWSHPAVFDRPGKYAIAVRAADQYSGIQRDDRRDAFPAGVTGIHRIAVIVL